MVEAPKAYTPRPYAYMAWDFLHANQRGNLYAGMGLGKTSIILTLLDVYYNILGETEPTLVLAPLRVARDTWPRETEKWEHLRDLRVVSVTGDASARAAALRQRAHVFAINYDNVVWLVKHFEQAGKSWPFTRIVADESTRLKSFRTRQGGIRAQALGALAHTRIKSFWNLTGTPSPNGLKDLWGQQWFIDAGQRLGRTYSAFENRWFGYRRVKDAISGRMDIQPVIFPHSDREIHQRLADCTLSINPRDWFDLRDPIINVIEVDLPASVRKHYREIEREFFAEIQGYEVDAPNAAAKSIKCLQMANGAVYADDSGKQLTVEVHDEKLMALESIVEEAAGAPILVAYHFKSDLARLQRAFPQGRTLDADPDTIQRWNEGRIPVLFAHPASAGHGLNLQDGGNIIVFFGHWWDLEQHDQIIERIGPVRQLQAGHDRPVFIHYIVARDTVDEVVMARRESKRSVQDLLMDYMKGKK